MKMMNYDELDPAAILEALGLPGATVAGHVTGGTDTAVWRVTRGNDAFALRVFGPGRMESCHREAETMSAAGAAGLPVPRVHALGAWEGHPAVLLSWCAGRTLLQELQSRPWRIWPLGLRFGRMQAAIHAVAAPPILRQHPEAWIQWAGPEEAALQERLRALAPSAAALLHLDYHPLNVMTDVLTGRGPTPSSAWSQSRRTLRRCTSLSSAGRWPLPGSVATSRWPDP
jgi:aminoglycoside phosphotransferase (APT) family kinase protein